MKPEKIELSRVLGQLRNELAKARQEGLEQTPRFIVDQAEIELQVGVTAEAEGKGGVNFWVYSAEAGGNLKRQAVQTIRLKLRPEHADGGRYDTSGAAPLPPRAEPLPEQPELDQ